MTNLITKRQYIEERVSNILNYANSQQFPFYDKLLEYVTNLDLEQIVSLIDKYLIPAYNQQLLQEYIEQEYQKLKLLSSLLPELSAYSNYDLTEAQKKYIIGQLEEIIRSIKN